MRVSDVLNIEFIMPDIMAREKRGVLDEMSTELSSKVDGLDREELLSALLERERLGTTGIGYGVAIPHAKLKGIDSVIVAFGRSRLGVDFEAMDSKPVHIFFLIVAPDNSTAAHLKILAGISRLLKENSFRDQLVNAPTREDIYRIIVEEDSRVLKGAAL